MFSFRSLLTTRVPFRLSICVSRGLTRYSRIDIFVYSLTRSSSLFSCGSISRLRGAKTTQIIRSFSSLLSNPPSLSSLPEEVSKNDLSDIKNKQEAINQKIENIKNKKKIIREERDFISSEVRNIVKLILEENMPQDVAAPIVSVHLKNTKILCKEEESLLQEEKQLRKEEESLRKKKEEESLRKKKEEESLRKEEESLRQQEVFYQNKIREY
jgi:hypothetical protein